ncbi:type II toxin-antitoxin system PemK/MazF family toxin [Streptomyces filamentosus]|uniref:type II toxin-antitoxin system PemK/MazF family toxin n=1 Tax=Streptomyces filamentosus TaxID=67294 RepID=UPI001238F387|nr:type II toxin-antitoxin system PemK/MazF family toxin [Streptomyces filamentosus]KAA6218815.1 type II toxin-antitoxin system PemK/MazF family toxin [Streptomyces filamentosus]
MSGTSQPQFPRRGDIYWVDFNPARGSEQAGHRPAVVISLDSFNRVMNTVVVAAMTTSVREGSKVQLTLEAGDPLPQRGSILGFQISTIDQTRLERHAGRLRPEQLEELNGVIALCFGLKS